MRVLFYDESHIFLWKNNHRGGVIQGKGLNHNLMIPLYKIGKLPIFNFQWCSRTGECSRKTQELKTGLFAVAFERSICSRKVSIFVTLCPSE